MIKRLLKYIMLLSFALVLHQEIWGNLVFQQKVTTIITVAAILTIFELFLKPILKILLLPINLLTLGAIRWIINTLGLYLSVFFISDFLINDIHRSTSQLLGLTIPPLNFSGFWAYLVTSLSLSFIFYLFNFILKKKS